ncbi:hypothetical protein C466_15794 [Halorubrum distributum JCM 10118]|uniref:Uncharacterized protein n=1 Tax=Halorubrum distributum JCM 10118 TaxID=1227468 RepID=M0ESH1_9EURY|nr:hypothetical protein C466_15794 [Halorubrum distributum JCM 10118]
MLDEFVYLGRTEPRQPTNLMDDDEVEPTGLDVVEELIIDLAGVGGAAYDLGILLDVVDPEALQVFAGLVELSADVLVRRRDPGVYRRCRGSVFAHVFEDAFLI